MAYPFELRGKLKVDLPPASSEVTTAGDLAFQATILERMSLAAKHADVVTLGADPEEEVSFGDLGSAHVVMLRVLTLDAGTVLARLTHADGTDQVVPVDPALHLFCSSSPITALSLQRSAGVAARVSVFLGEEE